MNSIPASDLELPADLGELEQLPPLESFLAALNLDDTGARTSEDIFTGKNQWMPTGRVFGGQVAAQSIIAAARTLPDARTLHSMRGNFLRPGDIHTPITFSVERSHDGNSFSTRLVQAYQHGNPIWSMIASFQVDSEGLEHQIDGPVNVPQPEDLPSASAQVAVAGSKLASYWLHRRPFEMRFVDTPVYLQPPSNRTPEELVWLKATGPLPDDPMVHRAALAYASDYVMLDPILRRHGLTWTTPQLRMASLDHGVWWHRFARVDEWLLCVVRSPSSQGGRGLTTGEFYTRDGKLIATVAQEAMVRIKN